MKKSPDILQELRDIIRRLRAPDGCPWDRKQTPAHVKEYLTEELYELLEAIDSGEHHLIAEEAGDLFFLILFLVNMYEEQGALTLEQALTGIRDKMIHRHPHVFGAAQVSSSDEVKENWQVLKQQEGKKKKESRLDGIPENMPALSRAYYLSGKAAEVGFDWPDAGQVLESLKGEAGELEQALAGGSPDEIADEIGDMLFCLVNLGRHAGVEPEQALRRTNAKFISRFQYIEKGLRQKNRTLKEASLAEMDRLWDEAKQGERIPHEKGQSRE